MKYKVGDKVRVKKWEDLELEYEVDEDGYIYHGAFFNPEMKEFCGKEVEIEYIGMDEYLCHDNDFLWQDWMFEDVETKTIRIDEKQGIKIVRNHESVILQLTELNSIKTRQLDELMKFIAHLVPKAHKDYLSHHLNDVQLIDGIMYHVRKGK